MTQQKKSEAAFQFSLPMELLEKDQRGWKIRGVASTEDPDLQGEIVRQNGLDFSHIKKGLGLFNWNHKNDPQFILGKIDDARVENKETIVEGYLFDKVDNAKAIVQIMQSLKPEDKHRVQMSIEGKIVKRAGGDDKTIHQAQVEKVALTLDAVNPNTYAQLTKSLAAPSESMIMDSGPEIPLSQAMLQTLLDKAETLSKMLTAGAGYADAPGILAGGAALTTESLESDVQPKKPKKKKKKKAFDAEPTLKKPMQKSWQQGAQRDLFKSIIIKFQRLFPDVPMGEVVQMADNYIECRLQKGLPVVPPSEGA